VPDRTRPLIRLYNKTVNKDSPGLAVMMPYESVLIFDDADPQPKLNRHSDLALTDPFRVELENREDFFVMRNRFPLKTPPRDRIDLPLVRVHLLVPLEELSWEQTADSLKMLTG